MDPIYGPKSPLPFSCTEAEDMRKRFDAELALAFDGDANAIVRARTIMHMLRPLPITLVDRASKWAPIALAAVTQAQGSVPVECVVVGVMDQRMRLLKHEVVGMGGVGCAVFDIHVILRTVFMAGGFGVIVSHNHPSGDATPSADDVASTQRLMKACSAAGIQFVDHVVVAHTGEYVSMRESGRIYV